MAISQKTSTTYRTLILICLWSCTELMGVRTSEDVYFDKYGHCSRNFKPFSLADDTYNIHSKGGGFSHESLICSLTFKADPNHGVCMDFKDFFIDDCSTKLVIFEGKNDDGDLWKGLDCHSSQPSEMCTAGRYVTLQVVKTRLNKNKGYGFQIAIKQSTSVTEGDVVSASISLILGVVIGVFILLAVIAVVVYRCCLRKGGDSDATSKYPMTSSDRVDASAPVDDASEHLYPPPPAYEHPPPYSSQHS